MRPHKGFSLIELLVVFTVIGIVAAFAFPAYTDYVRRGKVAEATSNLADLRVKMEQFFQDNRTYLNTAGVCAVGTAIALPTGSNAQYFDYSCPAATASATTYTIQAAAKAGLDISGLTYTIDHSNVKATNITGGSTIANGGWTGNTSCWVTKKGGVC